MQTRKCHADDDADANANANASRIRTKNNMSPSPSVGDIKTFLGPYLNTFGELVSNCIIFMALASASKIISGNRVKYFRGARYYFQGAREY